MDEIYESWTKDATGCPITPHADIYPLRDDGGDYAVIRFNTGQESVRCASLVQARHTLRQTGWVMWTSLYKSEVRYVVRVHDQYGGLLDEVKTKVALERALRTLAPHKCIVEYA